MKINKYVEDTVNRVINEMLNGTPPWRRQWKLLMPVNARTGRKFRGVNVPLLWMANQECNEWATLKQWGFMGCKVKKGEKATPVIFSTYVKKEDADGDDMGYWLYRVYHEFNATQVEGYKPAERVVVGKPHDEAERLIFNTGARIRRGGDQPCYYPIKDCVEIPVNENFTNMDHMYHTMFHELAHWTGHKSRLDRIDFKIKGDADYAAEELVAELCASSLYSQFQLDTPTDEIGDAHYLAGWWKQIDPKERTRRFMNACTQASEAFEYMIDLDQKAQREEKAA